MKSAGSFIKDHPVGISAALVTSGLLLGGILGGTVGCSIYASQMAFLHGGVVQSCGQSPVVLLGSTGVGVMIGASCSLLAIVFIYLRGNLTVYFSLAGAALSLAAFAAWVLRGDDVKGFEGYVFTGAFIALGGLAIGAVTGVIADHLRSA